MRVVIAGAGIAGLARRARARPRRSHRDDPRARRDADAGDAPTRPSRLGAPGRAAGAALARVPRPAAQPAARARARCARAAAGRGRDRDPVHRPPARDAHRPRPAVRATRCWSRSRAGARRSSGCCGGCVLARAGRRASRRRRGRRPRRRRSASTARAGVRVRDAASESTIAGRSRRRRARPARVGSDGGSAAIGVASRRPRSCTRAASSTSRASTGCATAPRCRPCDGPIAGDLGYLKFAVFLGDNRHVLDHATRSSADDDELRRALADAGRLRGRRACAGRGRAVAWLDGRRRADHRRARHGRSAQPVPPARRRRRSPIVRRLRRGRRRVGVHEPALRARAARSRSCTRSGSPTRCASTRDDLDALRCSPSPSSPSASSIRGSAPRCSRTTQATRQPRRRASCAGRGSDARSCRRVVPRRAAARAADLTGRVPRVPALVQPVGDARRADGRPRDRHRGAWPRTTTARTAPAAARPLGPARPRRRSSSTRVSRRAGARRSRTMSATCGRIALSSVGSYATSVSAAARRQHRRVEILEALVGDERGDLGAEAARERVLVHTSTRPVLRTDSATMSRSHGEIVRRSMISTPASARRVAARASSARCTVAPHVTTVARVAARHVRALAERQHPVGGRHRIAVVALPVEVLVLEEQHGVLAAERGAQEPDRVARARRERDQQARECGRRSTRRTGCARSRRPAGSRRSGCARPSGT